MDRSEVERLLEVYDLDELCQIGGFDDLADLFRFLYDQGILEPPEARPL